MLVQIYLKMCNLYSRSLLMFVVALTGLIYSLAFIFKIFSIFYRYWLRPSKNLQKLYGNGYAVITGASKGIGLQYAYRLASIGYNVILIARTRSILEEQCKYITQKYHVKATCIPFDFSCPPQESSYTTLNESLKDKDISILINNAGVLEAVPFERMTVECIKAQCAVNTCACTVMSKIVVERMLAKKGKSAIVNISSLTSDSIIHTFEHYGATKAYIETLSKSMEIDYRGKIDVMCVKYGPVYTDMMPIWFVPGVISAESAVKQSLSQLGYEKVIYGHWLHEIFGVLTGYMRWAVPYISGIISSNFLKRLLTKKKLN